MFFGAVDMLREGAGEASAPESPEHKTAGHLQDRGAFGGLPGRPAPTLLAVAGQAPPNGQIRRPIAR